MAGISGFHKPTIGVVIVIVIVLLVAYHLLAKRAK